MIGDSLASHSGSYCTYDESVLLAVTCDCLVIVSCEMLRPEADAIEGRRGAPSAQHAMQ